MASQGCGRQRPDVDDATVSTVLKEYYGLELVGVHKLPGYDDFTALVKYTTTYQNVTLKAVIKILGEDGSSKESYQLFINDMLKFLVDEGISVSAPIKCLDESLTPPFIFLPHEANTVCQGHYVHLLEYIEGIMLRSIEYATPAGFLYEMGSSIGQFHVAVQKFPGKLPDKRPSPWHLVDAELLPSKLEQIQLDNEDFLLVQRAVSDFCSHMSECAVNLQCCLLHGDINEANIIVREDNSSKSIHFVGLIDFGEMVEGPIVLDLAILILAIVHQNGQDGLNILDITKEIARGYCDGGGSLTKEDMKLLYHAIAVRCAQEVVMPTYDAERDPDNAAYILYAVQDSLKFLKYFYRSYNKSDFINQLLD